MFDFIAELRVAGDDLSMCEGLGIEMKTKNLLLKQQLYAHDVHDACYSACQLQ